MSRSRRNSARGKVICKKWIYLERHIFHRRQLIAKVSFRDGGVEGCALIFFSKNTKIATNDHQQENVGSHQKKIPHIQGERRTPNKMLGGAQSCLKSNLRPARDAWRAQTQPCMHQDQRRGTVTPHKRLSQTCVCVSPAEILVGSDLPWDRGSGCSRPGRRSVWHKSSLRRSPLAPA